MVGRLAAHEPLLINTIGYSAGTVLFAVFLYLALRDPVGRRLRAGGLSILAAGLALFWNASSLVVMGLVEARSPAAGLVVALSTAALTLLPAVLLQLLLRGRFRLFWIAGYVVSGAAIGIHWSEFLLNAPRFHLHALWFTTISFGVLTLLAAASLLVSWSGDQQQTSRLLGTMALFLFALSIIHLGMGHQLHPWLLELLIHHASIPVVLFVLLQDFRFVLLDAFVRVAANLVLAGCCVFAAVRVGASLGWPAPDLGNPYRQGLLLVGASLALVGFALLRGASERLLTRILFRRPAIESALRELRTHLRMPSETEYLEWALPRVADYVKADFIPATSADAAALDRSEIRAPTPVASMGSCHDRLEARGVHVVVPVRFSRTEARYLLLGRRPGGRPYLSEDLEALDRLVRQVTEHVNHFRQIEIRRLVSQAELQALQSQIHPHFLFNALNTLYGVIPKQAAAARRIVLNLADILRYFLQSARTYVPLEEELRIVEAYLEVERLRLGPRLRTRIQVEPDAMRAPIPLLSIEPLVENAVKHGVASQPEGGEVELDATLRGEMLTVRVTDTGGGFPETGPRETSGHEGIGLDNVRRRLKLCYGEETDLLIDSTPQGTSVEFKIPARALMEAEA